MVHIAKHHWLQTIGLVSLVVVEVLFQKVSMNQAHILSHALTYFEWWSNMYALMTCT